MEMVTIPKAEYNRLKEIEKVDKALLEDITQGIKDVVSGKIREVKRLFTSLFISSLYTDK